MPRIFARQQTRSEADAQEAMIESITLLGDYVIPELKAQGAKRTATSLERSVAMQQAAE